MPSSRLGFLALALTLAACGGGSAGGPPSTHTAGIALPSEISALPARGTLAAGVADVLPGGDYAAAPVRKYVDERALSQFDILNTIFGAVAQTHYADAENVNAGPYAAIVSWTDQGDGKAQKQLVKWVVDSRVVSVEGQAVNQVQIWFFMPDQGSVRIIPVALDITQAPVQNADGTYADYGAWSIVAKLSPDGAKYFVARADHTDAGLSRITLHDTSSDGGAETTGVLVRGAGTGYGKVTYPDYSSCQSPGCLPTPVTVAYAYDSSAVALDRGGQVGWKSRTDSVDVVQRYGLFDLASGADVGRTHSFGFPVQLTLGGVQQWAYYGAWQGRHQLWANGLSVPAGTTVTRADLRAGEAPQAFVTSPVYAGDLVKRTFAATSMDELVGLVVSTWVSDSAQLTFDGQAWSACLNPQWTGAPQPTCGPGSGPVGSLAFLATDPANPQRQVSINYWDPGAGAPVNLVYQGGQLWIATGQPPQATGQAWTPVQGSTLWVNINDDAWVVWSGSAWQQRHVVSVDPQTNTPTFDSQVSPFTFSAGDHMLNANGVSYQLTVSDAGFVARIERDVVPNPVTAASVVPAGLRFRRAWGGDTASVFRFGTAPSGADFMQLVYDQVGPQDQAAGRAVDDPVQEGIWNLVAELDGSATGDAFSWEYPRPQDDGWATQQFLVQDGVYRVVDDPIRLAPVSLQSHALVSRSYALQFDGQWVNGLPNVSEELRQVGYDMTADIADQIVTIPDGTVVADAAAAGQQYVFKALEVSEYLLAIADPGDLSLDAAHGLSLADVPAYVDQGMGPPPAAVLKYSEGTPLQ